MSIEEIIKRAQSDGTFDNLEGQGKPQDLSDGANLPEELRMTYHILKNAGVVPEEVSSLKEIAVLREKLKVLSDPEEVRALRTRIANLESAVNIKKERIASYRRSRFS